MSGDPDDLDEEAREQSPLDALTVSMVSLANGLEKAFDSESNRKDVKYERVRYVHALNAISTFLRENSAPLHYSRRLHRLAMALNDANEGRADPLLVPTSFGGVNTGDPTVVWEARANAALGMAVLAARGAKRLEAAETARGKIGADIDVTTYVSWYDQFRSPAQRSKIKNEQARALFDNGRSLIDPNISAAAARRLSDYFFKLADTQFMRLAQNSQ
jgi:hypothetical protein